MKRASLTSAGIFAVAIAVWSAWFASVLSYQSGSLPFYGRTNGSLADAGQFGDAFGALASLMAALAAAAALSAFLRQREEVRSQEFERNFFTLLANLQGLIKEIDIKRATSEEVQELWRLSQGSQFPKLTFEYERQFFDPKSTTVGRDALRALLHNLRLKIGDPNIFSDSKAIYRKYRAFYDLWHDDLGHYFRTLYHIFKMVDEECPSNKKRYSRIARSHLSSSEIVLLAYNCSVGEGRHRFKKYLIDFELLNNYHLHELDEFYKVELSFFERVFGDAAFGKREERPFVYE